ncbi:MAG: arsenite efflux transporter metallochaperone ArsD [Thermoleophilia bacterium]
MPKIEIFDPPQCCSTGVCGPKVDENLVRFAADLDWLGKNGAPVERFNLAQQPDAFMGNDAVREKLVIEGNGCLPLVVVDGEIVLSGCYPDRGVLAVMAQI